MARIEDIERRLQNWARWKAGGSGGAMGYACVDLAAAGGGQGGYREAALPTSDCEAEETDRAVLALPSELRASVEATYLDRRGMADKARLLGVAEATVYARVEAAHRRIASWLMDLAACRRAERARLEALQRAARP